MADSPFSTPKRKRDQLADDDKIPNLNSIAKFTFDPHGPAVEDGSMSPRSRVAHKFRGLTLEGGGGVTSGGSPAASTTSPKSEPRSISDALNHAFSAMHDDMQDGARKRVKLPDMHKSDADSSEPQAPAAAAKPPSEPNSTPPKASLMSSSEAAKPTTLTTPTKDHRPGAQRRQSPKAVQFAVDTAVVEQSETVANTGSTDASSSSVGSRRSHSPPPKLSSPRSRQRAGTPPLMSKSSNSSTNGLDSSDKPPVITDSVRASLTWHDDEITIYDPEDSDDDGTGINGIGFKPTPAIAYARTVRRRQQLAEYRKREEREARAKRNQRRRGSPVPGLVELKGKVERRRVRFMESATELMSF
ncbi:hypothetical protein B0H66DRAFT_381054 [Apodospora peruviana]|uniref:Uncharacterized protein n=1 Tax=Apodospora peruviana TaxID=516989 RepID=A0AAE0HTW9_9PEZI|nr:hypothetical protein B0H66DRAFT_381054 [Apodospora peruviana]